MKYYLQALTKFATFKGRARRLEYWSFFFINIFLVKLGYRLIGETFVIAHLLILIPSIAVAVRRVHDVGKNGWFILIPIYNVILFCTKGTSGDNEYGSDPKEEDYNL